jgi:glycosyltransferase involved in cell wall biosynthesis
VTLPRVLLVSDVVPGRGNVGREYLRAACRLLPRDHVSVFDFDPGGREALAPELAGIEIRHETSPDARPRAPRSAWAWRRHLEERRRDQQEVPALVERIAAFGREQRVDRLWVPLHSPTSVRIAVPLAKKLQVPLMTTTWDPPSYKLSAFGVGRRMRRHLLKRFDAANRYAVACSAASEPMRDLYQRLYGTPTVTMILGAPRPQLSSPPDGGRQSPFRIAFAGSLYARQEFNALLDALERQRWTVAGRPVELELFGNHGGLERPGKIHSRGWCDPEQTVRRISACDAAYLPYWFERRRREVVEVSFPGKLAMYAAARLPVFYHGPAYGSPVKFLERFPFGKVCATVKPDAIAAKLSAFVSNDAWLKGARAASDRAYEAELSAAVFRERFARLLGVDTEALLPLESGEIEPDSLRVRG